MVIYKGTLRFLRRAPCPTPPQDDSATWTGHSGPSQEEQGCLGGSQPVAARSTGARLDPRESWKGLGTQVGPPEG